jgi:o-succinylbenzoate synthase
LGNRTYGNWLYAVRADKKVVISLTLHPYTLQFKQPAPTSRGLLRERALWFLEARDDTGLSGWGECGPIPGLSADDRPDFEQVMSNQLLVISDWLSGEAASVPLPAVCHALITNHHQSPITALPSFAFALETALRDLAGGGAGLLWPSPFARGEAGLPTHGLLWMDSAAGLLRQAEAKLAAGFTVLKLKVGALPFDREVALLAALRRRAPGAELRLDANGAWSPQEALDKLDRLRPFEIAFLEQPIRAGQPDALAELCAASPVPIVLDEELVGVAPSEAPGLLARVRPHGIIVKPALLRGFAAAEAWIAAAEALGIRWWANSLLESNVGLNAICQWVAARGPETAARVHGLGTGGLFANNTPPAVELRGAELWHVGRSNAPPYLGGGDSGGG